MFRWIPYTFVRTVLFFIGGIVTGYYQPSLISVSFAFVLAGALLVAYVAVARRGRQVRPRPNPGSIALSVVFILGYVHVGLQTESEEEDHLLRCTEEVFAFRAIVTRFPEERARSWKLEARVDGIYTPHWQERRGGIVLYFDKSDFPEPFVYGDVLLIRGVPQLPDSARNPRQFDYRRHLALRNIYHQCFVRGDDVHKVGHAPDNVVRKFAYQCRRRAGAVLDRYLSGDRERGVASALVLGVTDGLDNDLLAAYSGTGTMHILAVSGLHISVIYMILLRVLSPLNNSRRGRWIVAFVSLALLWLYALITGLSPSVLRAVMMFSFLAIAKPWSRSTNVYNTLAVSAFFLLVYDPFLVFSVGFQLSYIAVLGIVHIYPRILHAWQPDHVITVHVWKAAAVSISAQLATLPVSLLYFHQFPNYFLVSNLLVVPLSFVILVAGLVLIGVSFISVVAVVIGICLSWIVRLANGIVFAMDNLPFAVIDNLYISVAQAMLLLLLIALVLTLFDTKEFRYVVYCFTTVLAFSILQWVHFYRNVDVRSLVVYHVPGRSAIDLIDCGRVYFLGDSAVRHAPRTMTFHVAPYRIATGVSRDDPATEVHRFQGGTLTRWGGGLVLQLTARDYVIPKGVSVDCLVVSRNAVRDPGELVGRIRCGVVVLDSSNSFLLAARFLEAAKLYNLDVHSVLHHGAYVTSNRNT